MLRPSFCHFVAEPYVDWLTSGIWRWHRHVIAVSVYHKASIAKSHKVSKAWDYMLELSYHFEILLCRGMKITSISAKSQSGVDQFLLPRDLARCWMKMIFASTLSALRAPCVEHLVNVSFDKTSYHKIPQNFRIKSNNVQVILKFDSCLYFHLPYFIVPKVHYFLHGTLVLFYIDVIFTLSIILGNICMTLYFTSFLWMRWNRQIKQSLRKKKAHLAYILLP